MKVISHYGLIIQSSIRTFKQMHIQTANRNADIKVTDIKNVKEN
jgi:hypothetical protein